MGLYSSAMKRIVVTLCACLSLNACSMSDLGTAPGEERVSGSVSQDIRRREERGKLTGEDGLTLFGNTNKPGEAGVTTGITVNGYLWRATLDRLSFMPIASADAFGGIVLTDWYMPPETPDERFKVNAFILTKTLRSDGIKISVFKQKLEHNVWKDLPVDVSLARKLEDAVLARARELKITGGSTK